MISGRRKLAGLEKSVRAAAEWALEVADYYGVPVQVTSGYRSWAEQTRLYRNYQKCVREGNFGRTAQCKWPANPPGESSHEYGLSFDSVVSPEYQAWWNYVRQYAGFQIPSNDVIHAQVPNWRSYR